MEDRNELNGGEMLVRRNGVDQVGEWNGLQGELGMESGEVQGEDIQLLEELDLEAGEITRGNRRDVSEGIFTTPSHEVRGVVCRGRGSWVTLNITILRKGADPGGGL